MKTTTTDTPRTDACTHCGAEYKKQEDADYLCGSIYWPHTKSVERSELCCELEARQNAEAEVERLRDAMRKIQDLALIKANKCLGCAASEEEEEAYRALNPTTK